MLPVRWRASGDIFCCRWARRVGAWDPGCDDAVLGLLASAGQGARAAAADGRGGGAATGKLRPVSYLWSTKPMSDATGEPDFAAEIFRWGGEPTRTMVMQRWQGGQAERRRGCVERQHKTADAPCLLYSGGVGGVREQRGRRAPSHAGVLRRQE